MNIDKKILADYGWYLDSLNRFCIAEDTHPTGRETYELLLDKVSVSYAKRSADAIALTSVPSGNLFHSTFTSKTGLENVVVLRTIIAKQVIEEFLADRQSLLPYLYAMVEQLKNIKGYGPETLTTGCGYALFNRPGHLTEFVRQTTGGDFELRLYSDCDKVEVIS